MGPYDNEAGCYVPCAEVEAAHWFQNTESGELYIIPLESQNFESFGPDDDVLDELNGMSDEALLDGSALASELERVPDVLKRFDSQRGYYTA